MLRRFPFHRTLGRWGLKAAVGEPLQTIMEAEKMYGDNPTTPLATKALLMEERATRVRCLLNDLDRLEAMATAAQPSEMHYFGWSNLASDSGLTGEQEDFVDYWSPERVIEDCRAKRELVAAIQTRKEALNDDDAELNRLLFRIVDKDHDTAS